MNTEQVEKDEALIRGMIEDWSRALEAKDLDALLKDYAEDAVLYDAIPPYKKVGVKEIRDIWEHCLPYFPESFVSEHRDLEVCVNGDAAFVFGMHHLIAEDHPAGKSWLRVTIGLSREGGSWKVKHEHVSQPFNPLDGQVWTIGDPAVLDGPDYSQGC